MGLFPDKEYFNISKTWLKSKHKQSEISWHEDYAFSINRLHIILMMLINDIISKGGIPK